MLKLVLNRYLFKYIYVNNFVAVRCESTNRIDSTINFIENRVRKLRIYEDIELQPAGLNWQYLLSKHNLSYIDLNNKNRKGHGDIQLVVNQENAKIIFSLLLII